MAQIAVMIVGSMIGTEKTGLLFVGLHVIRIQFDDRVDHCVSHDIKVLNITTELRLICLLLLKGTEAAFCG